jgi:CheY-like chemotaxis protein
VIVRKLLEAMQGRLEVRSQLGQGSSFIAWVPQAEVSAASAANPSATDAAQLAPHQACGTELRVLYAEDNDINAELVLEVLKLRPGCLVRVATSGAEALAMAREQAPDLFLLDMHLGDMSGFELTRQLQGEPTLRDVPRVAFSADAMPDQIHRARDQGFSGYLTKPLDVAALLACVDEHTERVRQRGQPR